jgi:hypothetical protein
MWQLRRRIAAKVAYAGRAFVNGLSQVPGSCIVWLCAGITKLPVLAEKAIERARLIKYGQVFKTAFWTGTIGKFGITNSSATGADPIRNAVCGQTIVIPAYIGLLSRNPT